MKRISLFVLVLVALASPIPADDKPVKSEDVAKDYKHLTAMTREPVNVDPALAMLCRGASQQDVEAAQKKSGPHAHTTVRIYMNEPAAEVFRKGATAYPVGAIVVKEKEGMTYSLDKPKRELTRTRDGVGGMIKRDEGYDPDHGDWEYFYFQDAAKIESGKIASCVQCHGAAAKKDYVFGAWAKEAGK